MNDDPLAQLHQSTYIMASCLSLCSVHDTQLQHVAVMRTAGVLQTTIYIKLSLCAFQTNFWSTLAHKSILVEGHSLTTLSITLEGFSFARHLLAFQTVAQADSDMFHGQDTYSCRKVGEMSAIGHHNNHHSYIAARPDVHMLQVHSRQQQQMVRVPSFIGMQAAQVSFCHLPVTSAIFSLCS